MRNEERLSFYSLWTRACEPYGRNFVPTDQGLDFIFNALAGYEIQDIARALQAHAMNPDGGRFAPKPADIVRHLVGDTGSLAQQAWTKVLTAIERVGCYESIVFDCPLIMATVEDMGGWLELNRIMDSEVPFKQNEFCTRYRGYLNNPPRRHPRLFIGLADAENERAGHKKQTEPRLIGDPQRCLQVYQRGGSKPTQSLRLSDMLSQADIARIEQGDKHTQKNPVLELVHRAAQA